MFTKSATLRGIPCIALCVSLCAPVDLRAQSTSAVEIQIKADQVASHVSPMLYGTPQPVHVALSGAGTVEAGGQVIAMSASSPADTNSITEPVKIVPVTTKVDGLSANFTRTFPPYSISVLEMKTK